MLIYEKKIEEINKLYGAPTNIPSENDEALTYKDSSGQTLTPSLDYKYLDDGHGGIIMVDGDERVELQAFVGNTRVVPAENGGGGGDDDFQKQFDKMTKGMPKPVAFIWGDYLYENPHMYDPTYPEGWEVQLQSISQESWEVVVSQLPEGMFAYDFGIPVVPTPTDKETYGDLLSYAFGENVIKVYCFRDLTSLKSAPELPKSATYLDGAFGGCTSLATAPVIPSTVVDIHAMFQDCTSLTTAPVIPASVIDMEGAFTGCNSLTGDIEINANPQSYTNWSTNTEHIINLTGSSEMLEDLAANNGIGNILVNGKGKVDFNNVGPGGTATSDKEWAFEGEEITLTITPDAGYNIASAEVYDWQNNVVPFTENYKFIMPEGWAWVYINWGSPK